MGQTCLMTVDVEDWFHLVGAGLDYQFKHVSGGNETWGVYESRVARNTEWLLDELDAVGAKCTFFVLGWVADRYPELVAGISCRGHEVASHGYWHRIIRGQTQTDFREDVRRSRGVLEDITGLPVLGYRASTATINEWAVEVLADEGFVYDASLFPVSYHDVYGTLSRTQPDVPIERLDCGLWEVKFSTLRLGKFSLPWSGGGYFRLLPYPVFCRGIREVLRRCDVFCFYIHPWEIDENPPKLPDMRARYRIRRYVGINQARSRLRRLLRDFSFTSVSDALGKIENKE